MDRVRERTIQTKTPPYNICSWWTVSQFTPCYTQTVLGSVRKLVTPSPKQCADVGRKELFGIRPAAVRELVIQLGGSRRHFIKTFLELVSIFIEVVCLATYILTLRASPLEWKKENKWRETRRILKVFTANLMHHRAAPWLPSSHFRHTVKPETTQTKAIGF